MNDRDAERFRELRELLGATSPADEARSMITASPRRS
jgi:hypothetical protein